jgi:hypothetical protein
MIWKQKENVDQKNTIVQMKKKLILEIKPVTPDIIVRRKEKNRVPSHRKHTAKPGEKINHNTGTQVERYGPFICRKEPYSDRIEWKYGAVLQCRITAPTITDKYGSFTAVKVPFCDYGPKTYFKRIRFDRPGQ